MREELIKPRSQPGGAARLSSRPRPLQEIGAQPGLHALKSKAGANGLLYIPSGYRRETPKSAVVMLHGSGGTAEQGVRPFIDLADPLGLILLAPRSRGATWDLILGGYGADVEALDEFLGELFGQYAIDARHLAIAGFSDGASYALSLGLSNGDLFSHLIAFSPGFVAPESPRGKPGVYISHGIRDGVLKIQHCSRAIVPRLERGGCAVRYSEFDGGHTIPAEIALEAAKWFLSS